MVFIETPDTAKVAVQYESGGQDIVNTLWFENAGGWAEAALQLLADSVLDWAIDELIGYLSNDIQLISATATDQSVEGGAQAVATPPTTTVGGSSTNAASNNATGVVTFRTAKTGRSYRGRNYVSGIPNEYIITPVSLSAVWTAGILAAYEALADVEAAADCQHVVVSHYHALAPRAAGVTEVVTAYTMDTSVDSQRRRLQGRGV